MPQSKIFSTNKTLNVCGRLVDLSAPKVMGIVNVTPDSFYAGSRQSSVSILDAVDRMLKEGADFIDVGGYSSRPGADDISVDEELKRTIPVIKALHQTFPETIFSIDTFRSDVAQQAIDAGASMVNDISAGNLDPKMFEVVGRAGVPYVMMHMQGTPQTMNQHTTYQHLIKDIIDHFHQRVFKAHEAGIKDIIIDPGFGFAKTVQQNFELLNQLDHLRILGKPLLVGLSRKSMVWRTLNITPEEALNGTTALHTTALSNGASILRVHDVKEAVECIKLFNELNPVS
jgi:dihydropteroate synthase